MREAYLINRFIVFNSSSSDLTFRHRQTELEKFARA